MMSLRLQDMKSLSGGKALLYKHSSAVFSARCLLCFFGYGLAGNYILIAVLTYCISKSAAVFVSYNKKALILRAFCHLPGFAYLTRCPKFVKLTSINYVSLFAVLMDYEQYACKRFVIFF